VRLGRNKLTPGASETVAELRRAGKVLVLVTNDPRRSPEQSVRQLRDLRIRASVEEIVTVASAMHQALAQRHAGATAVVIGSPAIHRHVRDAGLRIVNGSDLVPHTQVSSSQATTASATGSCARRPRRCYRPRRRSCGWTGRRDRAQRRDWP
jgi:ribonucleotide monophosphatase NagD (HAD superfamily)